MYVVRECKYAGCHHRLACFLMIDSALPVQIAFLHSNELGKCQCPTLPEDFSDRKIIGSAIVEISLSHFS